MEKKIEPQEPDYKKSFQIIGNDAWQKEEEQYAQMRRKWDDVTEKLYVTDYPLHIDIELTNKCNLRCAMCERNFMTRPTGNMSVSFYKKIIDYCTAHDILSIKLNLWGESILHPDLMEMISYAKQQGIVNTQFNSNASLLNEKKCRQLVQSGLDRLTLSVDSLEKSTYENIRIGANIDKIIRNIDTLARIKKELGSATPYVTAQIIQMKDNQDDVKKFVETFSEKVDYVSVTNICAASGDETIMKHALVPYDCKNKVACAEIWHRLSISHDGNVTVCCQDYDFELKIGNLKDSDIHSLWHSDELNTLRERHKKLDFKGTLCQTCTANCTMDITPEN